MPNRITHLLCIVTLLTAVSTYAQKSKVRLVSHAGIGTITYSFPLARVDPGPDWRGYYMPRDGKTGIQVSAGTGAKFFDRLEVTANAAYLRYGSIDGIQAYGDLQCDITKTKLTPFAFLDIGYSHVWNQYDGGTGSGMTNMGFGAHYSLNKRHGVDLGAGWLMMQMNGFWSLKAGYTF